MSGSSPMQTRYTSLIALLALALVVPAAPLHAQDRTTEREQERTRRLQQRMQQMQKAWEDEKRALEAKLKAAEERAKAASGSGKSADSQAARLKRELKTAQDRNAELTRELADQTAEKQNLAARLADVEKNFGEAQQALNETAARLHGNEEQLRLLQSEGKARDATIAGREQEMKACEAKNAQLYTYGNELLEKYRKQGLFDRLLRAEPFLQLKQVQVENYIEEYRDKLDAQKIEHPRR